MIKKEHISKRKYHSSFIFFICSHVHVIVNKEKTLILFNFVDEILGLYYCLFHLKCIKNTFAITYVVIGKAVPLHTQCINMVCPTCITFKSDDYIYAL